MTNQTAAPRRRMPAEERHRQLIGAAITAFAEGGYAGTTTDQVARLAGVSQPYVVRVFGTKQALFLAAYRAAHQRIIATLRQAATDAAQGADVFAVLGSAYVGLLADQDVLRMQLHGFVAAADPQLGPAMRQLMVDVYELIRELTGASPEESRDFLARGMLINTLVALQLPEHIGDYPAAVELVECTLRKPTLS